MATLGPHSTCMLQVEIYSRDASTVVSIDQYSNKLTTTTYLPTSTKNIRTVRTYLHKLKYLVSQNPCLRFLKLSHHSPKPGRISVKGKVILICEDADYFALTGLASFCRSLLI